MLKLIQDFSPLGDHAIQLFPVATQQHTVDLANVQAFNRLFDQSLRSQLFWYARKSDRTIRDCGLASQIILADTNNLLGFRDDEVDGKGREKVDKEDV